VSTPFKAEPYLNPNGELRVALVHPQAGHYTHILDRAQVEALMAELQAALNFDDTAGDTESTPAAES